MRAQPGIQLQDLLDQPFRRRHISARSKHETHTRAVAYSQQRILDLPACLARTHLQGEPLRFNLQLRDPIKRFLDDDALWQGIDGEYIVMLGPESATERGADPALPTLNASVGAFTRLWLGVQPATGLAVTDDLAGPPDLLARLDRLLRFPAPKPDWDF